MACVTRAESSQRVRDSIVAAAVQIAAREGVVAITHRRLAAEAGVSLSSTTWHFATKSDILEAALRWTADREVARIGEIADRLGGMPFDLGAWADELADWLIGQVTTERDVTIALYRLQIELLGSPGAGDLHRDWGRRLRAVGERALDRTADLDIRLIAATLDGLRLSVIFAEEPEIEWLRTAVHRQLEALLA
jgi:DNA-binding transcriptional regulator YbjK